MTRVEILYLLPYLFSLGLSLGISLYVWEHRRVQGASAYAMLTSAQTLIILGFICELLSPDLRGKMLWDKIQWVFFAVAAISIPYFAVQYTHFRLSNPKLVWGLASIIPIILILGVITDPWLHLIYPNPTLNESFVFGELQYDFTWFVDIFAVYSYLTALAAFMILARRVVHPHRLYRAQVTAVIIGLLIPIMGTMFEYTHIKILSLRDTTPITSAIGNLIIAWSIFRFRWLDIVHIARDKVFESIGDLVFVLDAQDRIVDINPSALDMLDLTPSKVIGKPADPIFAEWPDVVEKFGKPINANLEVIVKRGDQDRHYDINSTLIYGSRGVYQGRIFVARDVTPYATLQHELQEINEELEKRVQVRTVELADAYDTTLEGWANALELRDKETEGHSRRVTRLTLLLAKELKIPKGDLVHIRRGAILHDIGKMGIPDEILLKNGVLTGPEKEIVSRHPLIAYQLLSRISFLEKALDIPYCHHELWDGSGYPRGLKGEGIPLAARLFSIVDVWDAIQSERPYNKSWTRQHAIQHLREKAGSQFDPVIVEVFLRLVEREGI